MLVFQVHVVTAELGKMGTQFEHLILVLAADPAEALLIGLQMAACRDRLMPLSGSVVTDSTLTDL